MTHNTSSPLLSFSLFDLHTPTIRCSAEDEAIAGLPTNGNTPPLAALVVVRIPAGGSIDFQLASIRSPYSPEISAREIPAGAWKHVLRPNDKESRSFLSFYFYSLFSFVYFSLLSNKIKEEDEEGKERYKKKIKRQKRIPILKKFDLPLKVKCRTKN